jgi:putative hemolysin
MTVFYINDERHCVPIMPWVTYETFDAALAEHPIDRMMHSDSLIRLPDHPVMITDRMTMAHSLEARVGGVTVA